jgi:hypothetical protein
MIHDIEVNPRDPSDAWARRQLPEFSPALLGCFVLSERADGSLAILDGSNRATLIRMAGEAERPQLCQVFTGLTTSQEAEIALEYNDRRTWTGIRKFQAALAVGDPVSCAIRDIAVKNGWRFGTESDDGVIRGVREFHLVIQTASRLEIMSTEAPRGTERWNAAIQNGTQTGLRMLEEAFEIYTAAFPDRPAGYAPIMIRGIALVLLRDGEKVQPERLATQIRDHSRGQRAMLADARTLGKTMRLQTADAIAMLVIKMYNTGLPGNGRTRLDPRWERLA